MWTNGEFTPKYEMTYNEIAQQYEAVIKLKQGYYSYQYLTKRDDGSIVPVSSEGNFFQTENKYQAFVYWRPIGERTDRLVGYSSVRTSYLVLTEAFFIKSFLDSLNNLSVIRHHQFHNITDRCLRNNKHGIEMHAFFIGLIICVQARFCNRDCKIRISLIVK